MQHYRQQNCYEILGVGENATSKEIAAKACLTPGELSSIPLNDPARIQQIANGLVLLAAMREVAAEILTDPFRREVYDENLAAFREWVDTTPQVLDAVELHPLYWAGGRLDFRNGDWSLPQESFRSERLSMINEARAIDNRLKSGSNEPMTQREFDKLCDTQTLSTPETRAAYFRVITKLAEGNPAPMHERPDTKRFDSHVNYLFHALIVHSDPMAHKLFSRWLKDAGEETVSAEALSLGYGDLMNSAESVYLDPTYTQAVRHVRVDAAVALIAKWPSLVTEQRLQHVDYKRRHEFPNDPSIRRLANAMHDALNAG